MCLVFVYAFGVIVWLKKQVEKHGLDSVSNEFQMLIESVCEEIFVISNAFPKDEDLYLEVMANVPEEYKKMIILPLDHLPTLDDWVTQSAKDLNERISEIKKWYRQNPPKSHFLSSEELINSDIEQIFFSPCQTEINKNDLETFDKAIGYKALNLLAVIRGLVIEIDGELINVLYMFQSVVSDFSRLKALRLENRELAKIQGQKGAGLLNLNRLKTIERAIKNSQAENKTFLYLDIAEAFGKTGEFAERFGRRAFKDFQTWEKIVETIDRGHVTFLSLQVPIWDEYGNLKASLLAHDFHEHEQLIKNHIDTIQENYFLFKK